MSFDRSHRGSRGKLQLDSALTTRWSGCVGVLVLGAIMWGQVLLGARWAEAERTWKSVAVNEINKMMGESYPAYTPDGGVACYVVEARPRPEWRPTSHLAKLIYWLDRHAFFPLRIESYDREGNLARIEVRTARLLNPRLGERGYASHFFLFWDVARDYLSYDIHDTYH